MNILIVDDNEDIVNMISKYIQLSGHKCSTSTSGKNGLSMIENENYDAVLLDISMPEFSGIDVIDSLKEDDKLKEQKIVLFTASSTTNSEIDELIQKGAHSCLRKPIDPDELVQYLENLDGPRITNN